MPSYDFKCQDCGTTYEVRLSMSADIPGVGRPGLETALGGGRPAGRGSGDFDPNHQVRIELIALLARVLDTLELSVLAFSTSFLKMASRSQRSQCR